MLISSPAAPTWNVWGAVANGASLGHWLGNGRLFIDQGGLEIGNGTTAPPSLEAEHCVAAVSY